MYEQHSVCVWLKPSPVSQECNNIAVTVSRKQACERQSAATQAVIRAIGVTTAPEVFNAIVEKIERDHDAFTELEKLQMARAVGTAIVKHGSMFSTMELLLRHVIQTPHRLCSWQCRLALWIALISCYGGFVLGDPVPQAERQARGRENRRDRQRAGFPARYV